jgi:hypothetical protein
LDRRIKGVKDRMKSEREKNIEKANEDEHLEVYKMHEREIKHFRERW